MYTHTTLELETTEYPTNKQLGINNDHEVYCDKMDAIEARRDMKATYTAAYRMLRSQYNWNLKDQRETWDAYQLAKVLFGEFATIAAYNTICGSQKQF